jgi:hypothetical protein
VAGTARVRGRCCGDASVGLASIGPESDRGDAAEYDLVEFRTIELSARPVKATFDEKHLNAIHRHLFQDIYSWAGELRTVDTSKPGDRAGFFPRQRFAFGVPAMKSPDTPGRLSSQAVRLRHGPGTA